MSERKPRVAIVGNVAKTEVDTTEPLKGNGKRSAPPAYVLYLTSEDIDGKRNFTESNKAAYMHNDWTLLEWRLFIIIVSRLNSIEMEGLEEGSDRSIEIHIPFSNLYNKLGISRQNARKLIEAAMDGLHTKMISFLRRDENGKFIHDTKDRYNFIYSSRVTMDYNKKTGKEYIHLIVKLNADLNYLFINLRREFFSIDSDLLLSLGNAAAIRLYILFLVALHKTDKQTNRTYNLPHLKMLIGKNGKYKKYNGFKQNIIQAAVNEINEKTDMNVSYKEEKEDRSKAVKAITFSFGFSKKEEKAGVGGYSHGTSMAQVDAETERREQAQSVQSAMLDKKLVAACLKQRLTQKQIASFASQYGYKNFRYLVWLFRVFDTKTFYKNLNDKEMSWGMIKTADGDVDVSFE